MLRLIARSG